jgi:NAD(P)-dependent dehydrogenase (short-subunit alcohol dehydrogenase family)
MGRSPFDLTGCVALITGESRGIGFAIAHQFLTHGADVLIAGHDAAETENARARLVVDGLSGSGTQPDSNARFILVLPRQSLCRPCIRNHQSFRRCPPYSRRGSWWV